METKCVHLPIRLRDSTRWWTPGESDTASVIQRFGDAQLSDCIFPRVQCGTGARNRNRWQIKNIHARVLDAPLFNPSPDWMPLQYSIHSLKRPAIFYLIYLSRKRSMCGKGGMVCNVCKMIGIFLEYITINTRYWTLVYTTVNMLVWIWPELLLYTKLNLVK